MHLRLPRDPRLNDHPRLPSPFIPLSVEMMDLYEPILAAAHPRMHTAMSVPTTPHSTGKGVHLRGAPTCSLTDRSGLVFP